MAESAEQPGLHRIVIVGGGAGGLELATRLGDTLGRRGKAVVTLVEQSRTHLWKPLLHEIAAGSMDTGHHELSYLAQAHWHHFRYRLGRMIGLDRAQHEIVVGAVIEDGEQVTAEARMGYDTLIIAVGSTTNDFGTKGVAEYAFSLDTPVQARQFHRRLINALLRAHAGQVPLGAGQLQVAIIGAGATGVELSAQLHNTTRGLIAYGLDNIDPERDVALHLIEAADRILPALPERLSAETRKLLENLHIQVHTGAKVAAVEADGVQLADGRKIAAELVVWAAGVKGPAFLHELDGLESNRIDQLVVHDTLQTTRDADIFAFGDCAACPWDNTGKPVPPRAQAAHQQASHLFRQIRRRLAGQAPQPFHYRDFGSLVSLGEYSTVGNLMGSLVGGSLMIEGYFARIMYLSLYKMHELALHGPTKVVLDTLARMITRRTEPVVKLH